MPPPRAAAAAAGIAGFRALAAVIGLIAVSGIVAAAPPAMQATYALDRAASDDVHRAIEATIEDMSSLRKPFARLRLRALNQPPQRIDVNATGSEVTITTDGRDEIRTPIDGQPVPWKRDDGEEFTIRTAWRERTLTRTFTAEDGERVNTYDFGADGSTLTMRVVLTSPQLPQPLTYTLVYRRSSP
jgi:hypothetical protein